MGVVSEAVDGVDIFVGVEAATLVDVVEDE